MIELHTLAWFVLASTLAALAPGPALLYTLARTLRGGRREGLLSAAGLFVGGQAHTLAAAFGLSALLASSAVAFSVLKFAGAAYLIYLGVRIWLAKDAIHTEVAASAERGAFWQGVLTEALNPKTALFFLAFIPQFVRPESGASILQFLVLGVLANVIFTLADLLLILLAAPFSRKLRSSARFRHGLKLGSGGTLVGLGVAAAVER